MLEEVVEFLGLHGLMLQQVLRDGAKLLCVLGEDLFAPGAGLVKDLLDLLVDDAGGLLGVALGLAEVAADENGVAGVVVGDGAEALAHAVAHDHIAGNGACLLDIARGAAGDIVQEEFFRRAAAEGHDDALKHLGFGLEVFQILLGPEEREASRRAAGDDGDIVYGVHMLEEFARDGVAGLVIGGELSGLLAHLAALLLGTHLDLEDSLVDILHVDEAVLAAHSQQCRLVHEVFEVRARKARCALGDGVEVHVLGELLVAGVDLQNGLAPADVGQADVYLTVEAARTQQGVVQDVRAVGGRHDDDALVVAEAVHLHQQLVEGLLALVVSAAEAAASLTADGVDLVDEDDGGGGLLGLLEQVAHAARADADIELYKVRAGDGQKLHARLTRDSLGKQGLAGARRADQQRALRNLAAEGRVFLRILEEVDDLHHFLLRAVQAGDVLESDLDFVLVGELAGGLAHIEGIAHAAAGAAGAPVHAPEHPHPEEDEEQRGENPLGEFRPGMVGVLHDHLELVPDRKVLIQFREVLLRVEPGGDQEIEVRRPARDGPARELVGVLGQALGTDLDLALEVVPHEDDLLDVARLGHRLDLLPFDLLGLGGLLVREQQPADAEDQQDVQPGEIEGYAEGLSALRIFLFVSHLCFGFFGRGLLALLVFLAGKVRPEVLQAVEFAVFLEEDVDDDVAVVLDDPEIVALALGTPELVALLLHLFGDVVGDGAHLGGVGAVAHHEEVRDGAVHLAHIQ